jgi:hypothetical protein
LNNIINPIKDMPSEVSLEAANAKVGKADPKKDAGAAKGKAPPAKPGKGGGGGGDAILAMYESSLPLPTSGIETVVLFLDTKLESLPLEGLEVFNKVPVMSRDFNLHMYMQRLKTIGHQAELHNNKGIPKDNLGYIIDPPKSLEA